MLKTLAAQIKEFKRDSILTPVFMILEVLMETLIPFLMASIIDNGVNKGDIHHIYVVGAFMVVAACFSLFAGIMGGKYGVAPMQGRTLGFLYCNKDKVICQKDIEQEFLISRATASKMLQSMEKKELITRKELKEDARLKQILLTKKGEQQHLKMMNFFSEMEKLLVDGMTKEEADELYSLLKRVRYNLEKNL